MNTSANDLESNFISKKENINSNSVLTNNAPEEAVKIINSLSEKEELKIGTAIKEITWIALPTMLFFMALFLMQTINLVFIGHTFKHNEKDDALDGIGISHLYLNCLFLSVVVGIIGGYETLGANAFGAKNYYLMGLYLHRAQIIAYLLTAVLLTFHYFYAVKIISLFGIDEKVLAYVDQYIKVTMFLIIFDVQFSLNFRHLNIIDKSHINLIILISTLSLHPLWCYIFIIVLDLGVQGAGLCLVISQMLNALCGILYITVFKPVPESIFFYNKNSFKGWWEYLKIALPATFLMCAEWWAFEVLSIIAIWVSKLDYTVHILLSNMNGILYTLSIGFGMASSIIVGKTICEKNVYIVKRYIKIIYIYSIIFMSIFVCILFIFRNYALLIYVDEDAVLQKGVQVIPIMCIVNLFDISQTILSAVCRGLGKQLIASLISFINFYVLQTSFGILFGKWLDWGVYGIWMGSLISCGLSAVSYFFILYVFFDFEKIQYETLNRLEQDAKMISTTYVEDKDDYMVKESEDSNHLNKSFQTS